MRCPACEHDGDKVVDSRSVQDGNAIRRRRECLQCGHRFTTYESIWAESVFVIKQDGRREPFDRDKVLRGVRRATEKRPVPASQVEELVNRVQAHCAKGGLSEITSAEIGDLIMQELRRLDEVAYVRFASVYRRFKDPAEFMDELKSLLNRTDPGEPGDA
ncbi:MAG: transcriptional regulator NrdR [Candidatus Eiseniibacteriota bacterium]|jgi:transcriptional repressor NrdR